MRIHPLLCGAIAGLALVAGCQREEAKPTTAPTPPAVPQPAERPVTPAPQTGTTAPSGTDAGRTVGQTVDDATITAKLKTALLQGGSPATPDDLRKRFEAFLNERCKGKDTTKLRFVVE